jgi:hypothetical protein
MEVLRYLLSIGGDGTDHLDAKPDLARSGAKRTMFNNRFQKFKGLGSSIAF